jgi:DNA-binding FrmR family transcriptional regulator
MPTLISELDPQAKERILVRLRNVKGHLGGIIRMVEEDQYCIDVIRQTKAIQNAIDKVNALLLERHLNHCVSRAIRSSNGKERERVISELLDIFDAGRTG